MTVDSEPRASPVPAKTRRMKPPKPKPDYCLNCGAAATGRFCAECGQEIKEHSVSLGPLLSEGLSELASWDSKLFRTLMPLLFRPGFLTNQYNAGKRVPYLSPIKLYLTVSVLFFLLLAWQNPITSRNTHLQVEASNPQQANMSTVAEYDTQQAALPARERDVLFKHTMKRQAYKAKQSPQALVSALIGDVPKMMFFLLPLFAVSLKLLYWRPKRLYVEHLIFLLHAHAFAFLILTPLLFLHPAWLLGSISLALTVYVLVAMRVVYKQSWLATIGKFLLLGLGYVTLLSLCICGTLLVALWLL